MLLVEKDNSVNSVFFFFNVVVDAASVISQHSLPNNIQSFDLNITILPSQQLETVILTSHNCNWRRDGLIESTVPLMWS